MITKLADVEINEQMHFRANKDIVSRSFNGTFIYLLVWFALITPTQFYSSAPSICLAFTSIFIFLSLSRIALTLNFERLFKKQPRLWRQLFPPLVWGSALSWGVLCAMALVLPIFEPISLAVIISTAGFCGGGVAALVPDRSLTIGLIAGYLLPSIITLLFFNTQSVSILLLFIIFAVGMFIVTKIQYKEYWLGLSSYFIAKEQAEKLKMLNTMDALTGLKNRAFFDDYLTLSIKKAVRSQSALSLLLIDIDHFKKINDNYGHLVGDECLRQLSILLKKQVKRENDVVARYGGEEFAVILPDTSRQDTLNLAEQIRNSVTNMVFRHKTLELHITISIGISNSTPAFDESKDDFFEKADTALYQAKNAGRNQVIM
ncbi:GGDEF domain-containing protein [Psychromonas ossibalaenae]|uniref:GGDEF domain-containing protein n=1 Tax=Psychromonas ossibalaenae TaxID=444922 RepID=UPI0003737CC5|nr:GGDEF domain-containing protein [Psychromonas ossibalaenae]